MLAVSGDTTIAIVFGVTGTLVAVGGLVLTYRQLAIMKKEARKSTPTAKTLLYTADQHP
jgi:hypothetical protein